MENKNISSKKFTDYSFSDNLLAGINDAGYENCTTVQERTFEFSLKGRDITVMSQTGTGKTAAFLISIFAQLNNDNSEQENIRKKTLILSPTRELAIQIEKEAKLLGKKMGLLIGSFYGGVGYNSQELLLKNKVDVVIGTPGRILDFMEQKKLLLKDFNFLVIDEADRLFDMGFYPDVQRIIRKMPSKENRQTMMFSATLSNEARMIVRNFMDKPEKIEITPDDMVVGNISQTLFHVGSAEKFNLMLGIIKKEVPKNVLVFTNMKNEAIKVSKKLEHNGFVSSYLIGDLKQSKRIGTIEDFKKNKLQILVATDVAARGLHVDDLEMVINYDLPNEAESYVHRVGRTARAGKTGKAISFGCDKYVYNLDAIEDFIGEKIPVVFADDDYYVEAKKGFKDMDMATTKRKPVKKNKPRVKTDRKKITEKTNEKNNVRTKDIKPNKDKWKAKKEATKIDKKKNIAKPKKKYQKREDIKSASTEDRLAYYKKKYGEDFTITGKDGKTIKTTKPGIVKKVKKVKKKKKLIKRIISFFKR